jgi:FkbM family methyltransferase
VPIEVGGAVVKIRPLDADHFARLWTFQDEPKVRQAILDTVRPGTIVWDVGGNIGYYGLIMAKLASSKGKVVVFEPSPDSFDELCRNVRLNELDNVNVEKIALGEAEAIVSMQLSPEPMSHRNTLVKDVPNEGVNTVMVQVMPGDLYRERVSADVPNLIKIDVEGYEEEVLRGLKDTLSQPACHTVICEVHFGILESRGKRDAPCDIVNYLRNLGFLSTSWLDKSHLRARKPQIVSPN